MGLLSDRNLLRFGDDVEHPLARGGIGAARREQKNR
jgi:hypothetical protein